MPSNSLEQEAMDRVRRMYASFDARPQQRPEPAREQAVSKADREPRVERPEPEPETNASQRNTAAQRPSGSLLDIFLKNQDQSLILLLMALLMKDGTDMNVMLALMYLLI